MARRIADLEMAEREHWYRIPGHIVFRRRPRYLAIYPVKRCGPRGGAITWYAAIGKISRHRRRKLIPRQPTHPRAGEWYWKLHLGPARELPRPIENRLRRRITFAYTTRDRLLRAEEIGELFDVPPLEEIVRQVLVSSGIRARSQFCVMQGKKCRYRLDFAVFCRKGKIALECDHSRWHRRAPRKKQDRKRDRWLEKRGWTVIHFSEDDILNRNARMIAAIGDSIRKVGGQAPTRPGAI
ncbi:MAG: DUF559 domain-containing protein [PVC group bacterium]